MKLSKYGLDIKYPKFIIGILGPIINRAFPGHYTDIIGTRHHQQQTPPHCRPWHQTPCDTQSCINQKALFNLLHKFIRIATKVYDFVDIFPLRSLGGRYLKQYFPYCAYNKNPDTKHSHFTSGFSSFFFMYRIHTHASAPIPTAVITFSSS